MNITAFRSLLDAYGPHASDWPDEIRQEATDLLAKSEAARVARLDAFRLDAALRSFVAPAGTERLLRLVEKTMDAAPERPFTPFPPAIPKGTPASWQIHPKMQGIGLMTAFALACFLAGIVISTNLDTRSSSLDFAGLPLRSETTVRIGIE